MRGALALALLAVACASPPSPTAPPPVCPDDGSPLFWEARGGASVGTLYLLGSVHVGREPLGDLGPRIGTAWQRAEELVLEVDITQIDAPGLAQDMYDRAALPAGESLAELLPPETWQRLRDLLSRRGVDTAIVSDREPWYVVFLVAQLEYLVAGYEPEYGIDRAFAERVGGDKPVVGLESADAQLALLDGLSWEEQVSLLSDTLDPAQDLDHEIQATWCAWSRGDEQALLELLVEDPERPELAVVYEKLIYARNRAMARRLAELAPDGRSRFVVVGAAHMVGPRGIPALLEARGYEVTRFGGPD